MNKVEEGCNSMDEMRAEIFKARYDDQLISRVMTMADYKGMSAEDRYTALAYEAIKKYQHLEAITLEFMSNSPVPRIVVDKV